MSGPRADADDHASAGSTSPSASTTPSSADRATAVEVRRSTPHASYQGRGERADLAERAPQRSGRQLDDGHRAAGGRRRRGDLGPDPAGADDDDARAGRSRARSACASSSVRRTCVRGPARAGGSTARDPHASTSPSYGSSPSAVSTTPGPQPGRGRPEPHVDAGQVQLERHDVDRAVQHGLGQRRPVVRRVRLGAEQHHLGDAGGDELDRGARAGQAGSDDHDALHADRVHDVAVWRNWAGNQRMSPAAVAHPDSVDEVARVVKEAAAAGRRVKAIGSGHSFTGIGLTDGVLVELDRLDRLVSADRETGRVVVQAGMPLRRLNRVLAEHGLGLTNMGDIDVQTVAGALSTGTHGTGRDSGALATQVLGLELVLADGSVLTCSREEDPEVFDVARVSLGALGIVTTVVLQAEPAFLLRADERPMPMADVLDGFDEHVAANEHFELYWFPGTRTALTKRNNRADVAAPLGRVRTFVEDELLSNGVFGATCWAARRAPRAVPALNRLAARSLAPRTYTDAAPQVFTSPRRVRFVEMEYALPRERAVDVLRELQRLPEARGVSFPVEVRVAPADDVPLSTASGRDTAYVAVHVHRGDPHERYFAAVEALVTAAEGRPHWGKLHTLAADDLRARYPRFDAFVAVRDRLDPERRFANAYLDRVLGA